MPFLFVFLLWTGPPELKAQSSYHLFVHSVDHDTSFIQNNLTFPAMLPDTNQVLEALQDIVRQLQQQSYFEASIDSIVWNGQKVHAFLHAGQVYEWAQLENGNVPVDFLNRSGFRERNYAGRVIQRDQLDKVMEGIITQAENNGYPFARVMLDQIRVEDSQVYAKILLKPGRLIFFDSLTYQGDVKISPNYLRNYLGIKPGDPYSRKKILQVRSRLRELPFLQEKEGVKVRFLDDKANLSLSLEKKKASRFDFLLGVLPDNGRPDNALLITGTFNSELYNQFGLGERIFISFERLRPQTQELELAFAYPYVLDLPFGVDLRFSQYKRDSTYTDVIGEAGVQYLFEGGNYIKAYWRTTASNLISVDTNAIRQGRFPDQLDVQNSDFGLEAYWQQLDYRFNPRKGWSTMLRGSAGTRQIQRNQSILNVNESFYDTLPARTYRFILEADLARYIPVWERGAIKAGLRTGAIISGKPVYQNEQYRLGGNRLLRGFDEESIFATFYTVWTLEYRLLIGQNSYFYVFGDYAYLEDRRAGRAVDFDHPLGIGGGLTFETGAGVFGISVAVGRSDRAPADFRNPKIHFGYVSIF